MHSTLSPIMMHNVTNTYILSSTCKMNAFEKTFFVWNNTYRISAYIVCISICIFGIIGNILAFTGLQNAKQCSIQFLLKTLAITDTAFLIIMINWTINSYIIDSEWDWISTYRCIYSAFILYYIIIPLFYFTHTITVWIAVLLGINRYIIVCYPLYAKQFSRVKVNKICICVIIGCAFILSSWSGIFANVTTVKVQNNLTCYRFESRFDNGKHLTWLIGNFHEQILIFLAPFITLLIITIGLIKALRRARQMRNRIQASPQQTQERILTRTVIAVLVVFTVCQSTLLVQLIVCLYLYVLKTDWSYEIFPFYNDVLIPSSNIFLAFNSSINIVIYIVVNRTYRQLMLKQICNR